MEVARTPQERFDAVTDYPYPPRYLDVADGLRLAYVDVSPGDVPGEGTTGDGTTGGAGDGAADAGAAGAAGAGSEGAAGGVAAEGPPVVVLVHGEPTWGYLYRRFVEPLVDAGLRVVVPDLIGFGRSDKPTAVEDYSFARHVEWLRTALFDVLDLERVTYLGQDWGGLLGLRLVAEHPDRFASVLLANTGLPTGDVPMPEAWQRFAQMVRTAPTLDVARMVASGCVRPLEPHELAAYAAPFPDDPRYLAGVRAFPGLVPNRPDDPASEDNRRAWRTLATLTLPFLCAFSDRDEVTRGGDRPIRERVPGARGRVHPTIENAGHFLQEDAPGALVDVLLRFVREADGGTGAGASPPGGGG